MCHYLPMGHKTLLMLLHPSWSLAASRASYYQRKMSHCPASTVTNWLRVEWNLNFEMCRRLHFWLIMGNLRSLCVTIASTRWWSLKMYLDRLKHLGGSFWLDHRAIWVDILPSWDLQLSLMMVLCEKMVPPTFRCKIGNKNCLLADSSMLVCYIRSHR